MRIAIRLRARRTCSIPLNYNAALQAALFEALGQQDAGFARRLHEGNGFKFWAFSQLRAARSRVAPPRLHIEPGTVFLEAASPADRFVHVLSASLLRQKYLLVEDTGLEVVGIETILPPAAAERVEIRCLSPVVAGIPQSGYDAPQWLLPGDAGLSAALRNNILRKYKALYGAEPDDTRFDVTWDSKYLETHKGTKGVQYKGGFIKGAFCPGTIEGNPKLIRLAWECGLGEKNSAGFGLLKYL